MVRESEAWVDLRDGTRLFEKTWMPVKPPKAHLIFLHGFSDRSEIHYYLFPTLAAEPYNIACHAIDQRGWGKTVQRPSQRGDMGPTSQVLADIDEYVAYVSDRKIPDGQKVPLFLMGHSMGGQEVLHYLLSTSTAIVSRSKLSGAIIEAPWIALDPASQPSRLLVMVGKLAAMLSPKWQMKQDLDSQYVTRDPEVNHAWDEDVLCHGYGTLEAMRDALKRGADLEILSELLQKGKDIPASLGLSQTVSVPVLLTHGAKDRITSFAATKKLSEALELVNRKDLPLGVGSQPHIEFKAYEHAYHKIHAEPHGDGELFSRYVAAWIMVVSGTGLDDTNEVHHDGSLKNVSEPVGTGPGQGGNDPEVKAKL